MSIPRKTRQRKQRLRFGKIVSAIKIPGDCDAANSEPTLFRRMKGSIDHRQDERAQGLNLNSPGKDCPGARRRWRRLVTAVSSMALVFAAPARPALAQDAKISVGMTGIGSMSCAHWRSSKEHLSEGIVWIYGFWTGLNYVAAASEQAQSATDSTAIVAEVKKACSSEPSQALASAVWTTYLEFNKK